MSNHFSYLLQDADIAPAVSADRLMLMAKTASQRYLKEGTPMNTTIAKLAEDNDLNRHQVERVCEMANIATHQALWPHAQEKEKIAFPLANPKVIVIRGGSPEAEPSSEKPVSCPSPSLNSDYASPPNLPENGPSMAQMFGVDPGQSHNGLSDDGPQKRLIIVIQKTAARKQQLQDKLIVETMRYENEKRAAYNAIKQEVLKGTSFADIQRAVHAIGFGKIAAELLPEFRDKLIAETHGQVRTHLEKVAISPAPQDYVSNDMGNVTVVNGAHPIVVSLDVLHKQDDKVQQLFTGLARVNDDLKVYGQRLREMQ